MMESAPEVDSGTTPEADNTSTALPEVDNGTTDTVGGISTDTLDLESGDGDGDDDDHLHDQLPSVEEYKTNMKNVGSPSRLSDGGRSRSRSNSRDTDGGEMANGDDDDEEYVHDQLPDVDEIKAAITGDTSWGCIHYLAIFVGLVVLTVIIVVPTILSQNKNNVSTTSSAQGQSPGQPASPTRSPVPAPTVPPLVRQDKIIKYLADVGISTETQLTTIGTPQNRAVEWLAFDDGLNMEVPDNGKKYTRFVERYVLAVFFYSTNGPSWTYSMKFLTGVDHCEWHDDFLTNGGSIMRLGVADCNTVASSEQTNGGLLATVLSLPLNKLVGTIPTELQYLHRLETFFAPFNEQLTGSLGFGLQALDRLQSFEVQYCGFTGGLPDEIGSLKKLTNLGLGNNKLEGTLPASFFELTDLELLGMDDNLFEADIASFGVFTKLKQAYLEDNLFTGELTDALVDNWAINMEELDLSVNNLNSTIPAGMFKLTNLAILDLHGTGLRGSIPDIVDPNGSLMLLALFDNDLTGPIPETISNLLTLRHLDLAKNKLTSPLPDSLGLLTDLRYLFMGQNDFSRHEFPTSLWSLTLLRELSMKNNSITGTIPSDISTLTSLQLLDLDGNRLVGTIPAEIGLLNGLDYLLLNRNILSGTLPSTFTLLYDLDMLLIDHNKINGTADVICKDTQINLTYFVADCEGPIVNINCSCCNLCCNDINATCNNLGWHVNLDPVWEYSYTRNSYQFSTEVVASEP